MGLERYLAPVTGRCTNICFDCERACGGCPWSEIAPKTGRPGFRPVPGWTARREKLKIGSQKGRPMVVETYHITACPLYIETPRRRTSPAELRERQFLRMAETAPWT